MSEFELPGPAPNLSDPQGLLRYAEEVQSHLERHELWISRDELDGVSKNLNELNTGLNETVILSGIFKRYKAAKSGDITEAEVSLEEGILQGSSFGFRILPIEDLEPTVWESDNYDEEEELYRKVRERAVGDYVVCHLVHYDASTTASPDAGILNVQHFQALGPIMSSDLYRVGEHEPQIHKVSLREAYTTLNSLKRPSRRAFRHLEQEVHAATDPLQALVRNAGEVRMLLNNNNEAVVLALRTYISQLGGMKGIGGPYLFTELPPVIKWDDMTSTFDIKDIDPMNYPIYVEHVLSDPRFFYNPRTKRAVQGHKPGQDLYLMAARVVHPTMIDRFSIPLSHIEEGTFVNLAKAHTGKVGTI